MFHTQPPTTYDSFSSLAEPQRTRNKPDFIGWIEKVLDLHDLYPIVVAARYLPRSASKSFHHHQIYLSRKLHGCAINFIEFFRQQTLRKPAQSIYSTDWNTDVITGPL